jgi:Cu/Ag efflux protein CusF
MKLQRTLITLTSGLALVTSLLFSSISLGAESTAQTKGVIQSVLLSKQMLKVAHDAVPKWGWMKMKMKFAVSPDIDLTTLKKGQAVDITLQKDADGKIIIIAIK